MYQLAMVVTRSLKCKLIYSGQLIRPSIVRVFGNVFLKFGKLNISSKVEMSLFCFGYGSLKTTTVTIETRGFFSVTNKLVGLSW